MEIRDPIHGTLELADSDVPVIDSAAYQRLRAIKQLGFSEFSFPGATHNRYLHSIGVYHLAGKAFESVFKGFGFKSDAKRKTIKQCLRLAALLHDIGHGPLSHASEEVMPPLATLKIRAYENLRTDIPLTDRSIDKNRKADHEDYTIKFLTDSSLTPILAKACEGFTPLHVACLIDKSLQVPDDFFVDQGLDLRPVLSQLVSSEMDCDRMDYLERDAYFCGTNYGKVELSWLLSNLTYHVVKNKAYLALNRRALYSFDDFLLARHHMHLMVYFHHKAIIFEELMTKYLTSVDCDFRLPSEIEDYIGCTDYALYQHMSKAKNEWAQRISKRQPYKMVFELHSTGPSDRMERMQQILEDNKILVIAASSSARLSKYHATSLEEREFPIYVVDQYDLLAEPYPIEMTTEIFQKYEEIRRIERIYVDPTMAEKAKSLIIKNKL